MPNTDLLAVAPTTIRPCESDRGEWGGLCPACGRQLPPRPDPLQSWHAARSTDRIRSDQARASARQTPLRHWHL
jgi:hypothetical protein